MITHIQGRLVEKTPTEVVIDCNGVGYHVNISLHTFSQLPASENIKVFTDYIPFIFLILIQCLLKPLIPTFSNNFFPSLLKS